MRKSKASAMPPRGAVRFVLDGRVVALDEVDPTRTVLQYLREDLRRTGTKEGCAEGDCGACTVVVVQLEGDDLRFRAVNSCIQFLPTLDGKALFTVESLRGDDGALHAVQRALVDCHGSQCGFCTPGFVMSMFAFYESTDRPSRREINEALAGNLCRCTGYRPIVEAASRMYDYGARRIPREPVVEQLRSIRRDDTLTLESGRRRYFAPTRVDALAALREQYPDSRLLAGGTDIALWVTKQHRDLDTLIYIGNVRDLAEITVSDDAIDVGATASLTDAFAVVIDEYPELETLCRRFASPPIRNAATLAGNVANASPIGDSMPALIALDSKVVLRRGKRVRVLPLDSFYVAYQKTALEPGEFIERVSIPRRRGSPIVRSYKVSKRFDQDISAVCGGFRIDVVDGVVREARIAYGGVAAIPKRAFACERALAGKRWSEETVRAAMNALDRDYAPLTDMRASAGYRRDVTRNLLWRLFVETTRPDVAIDVFAIA